MKNKLYFNIQVRHAFFFLFVVIFSLTRSLADDHCSHIVTQKNIPTVKAEIFIKEPLIKDKKAYAELMLASGKDNKPLLPTEIKKTHTERVHLLIFDQTLTDYQHVHPHPTNKPGIYQFEWTPKKTSNYRAWVDLTPRNTDKQEYIMVNLGVHSPNSKGVDKTTNSTYSIGEGEHKLHFVLSFDPSELIQGKPAMGRVVVKDAHGHPFSQLEPIMGTYAHIVAINQDFKTIAHIHPMGIEPSKSSDKGGPELGFHFEPNKAGFWKFWVQVKINGKEKFIPFGVNVR